MATDKQIEAARRNGAKSRGPVTKQGKARSSRNAIKHGLSSGYGILVNNERDELYEIMIFDYTHRFQPADRVESDLVERMVAAQWNICRMTNIIAAMQDLQMDRDTPKIEKEFNAIDEDTRLAIGFDSLANNGNGLALAGRYLSRAERSYDRALHSLRQLQRDRLNSPAAQPPASLQPVQQAPAMQPPATEIVPEKDIVPEQEILPEKRTNKPDLPAENPGIETPAETPQSRIRFIRKPEQIWTNEPDSPLVRKAGASVSTTPQDDSICAIPPAWAA